MKDADLDGFLGRCRTRSRKDDREAHDGCGKPTPNMRPPRDRSELFVHRVTFV